jgi:anti-sigma factor RsiW
MNHQEDILLWKYIDGDCTPDESDAVQKKLAEDAKFRKAYAERLKLHGELRNMEAEQPSMRFSMRIFESLPDLYGRFTIQPLIRPLWARAFLATLALLVIGFSTYAVLQVDPSAASSSGALSETVHDLTQASERIPYSLMTLLAALSAGFLILVWLDSRLRKRIVG